MAVTTLEAAAVIEKPEQRTKTRFAFPLKVLGTTNGILLAITIAAVSMPEMTQDVFDLVGIAQNSLLRQLDIREPAYMAFAVAWLIAVIYMHVDEINEHRLMLRSAPETEIIRAFTIEDLVGNFVRAAVLLIPASGLYFLPAYLHKASMTDHLAFILVFAAEYLLWRFVRKE